MSEVRLSNADVERAKQIWTQYQAVHDLSGREGQAVGIDPFSGRVWFGESMADIVHQMKREGSETPLLFLRVGLNYYCRKGIRR